MKIFLMLMILLSPSCGTTANEFLKDAPHPDAQHRGEFTDEQAAILEALKVILSEIKGQKSTFPQLSGIDTIKVRYYVVKGTDIIHAEIRYQKNITEYCEMCGPHFGPQGCLIDIRFEYPARPRQTNDTNIVLPLKLKNGKLFDIWNFVSASSSENDKNLSLICTVLLILKSQNLKNN